MTTMLDRYLCTLASVGMLNLVVFVTTGAFIQTCSPAYFNASNAVAAFPADPIRDRMGANGCVIFYVIVPVVFYPLTSCLIQLCFWNVWKKNPNVRPVVMFMCLLMFFLILVYGISVNRCWYRTYVFVIFFVSVVVHAVLFLLLQCSLHKIRFTRQRGSGEDSQDADSLLLHGEDTQVKTRYWNAASTPYALSTDNGAATPMVAALAKSADSA